MAYRISMRNRYSTSADNYRRFTTETTAPDASSESPSPHRIPFACLRSLTSIGQQQPSQQETWAPAANASFDQYIYDDCCGSMKSKQDSTDRLVSRIELVWMPHGRLAWRPLCLHSTGVGGGFGARHRSADCRTGTVIIARSEYRRRRLLEKMKCRAASSTPLHASQEQ